MRLDEHMTAITVIGIPGIPEVIAGDDLTSLIMEAAGKASIDIEDGDILVVTQKVVSKAEGQVVKLEEIEASPLAIQLSEGHHRNPRHTEVILRESVRIVRMDRGVIISETRHGLVCANAGVDASNLPEDGTLALLPLDSDASAQRIRAGVKERLGKELAVIISDTFGRPWREGATDVAIGVSGMDPVRDYRGRDDAYGRPLRSTVIAIADELAAAAELVTGKIEKVPVALIRGYPYRKLDKGAGTLQRAPEHDLFR